jgi:hypothetical protein
MLRLRTWAMRSMVRCWYQGLSVEGGVSSGMIQIVEGYVAYSDKMVWLNVQEMSLTCLVRALDNHIPC